MKINPPHKAHPPTGVFLEIVEHDKLMKSQRKILRDTKIIQINEIPKIMGEFRELNKKRARLSLYAQRALQPSTSD